MSTCASVPPDMSLTTALFWQHTVVAEHALPLPTPMMLIGLHSRPRRMLRSERTTPSKPRMTLPGAESACFVE